MKSSDKRSRWYGQSIDSHIYNLGLQLGRHEGIDGLFPAGPVRRLPGPDGGRRAAPGLCIPSQILAGAQILALDIPDGIFPDRHE